MKKIRFSVNFNATDDCGNNKVLFAAGQDYPADDAEARRCIARGIAEEVEVPDEAPAPPTREQLDAALATLPGSEKDPEYVVGAMRAFFGDLFTADDEAKVRDLVKADAPAPSPSPEPAPGSDAANAPAPSDAPAPSPAPAAATKKK